MVENEEYRVTLADGTEFDGVPDGAGNIIVSEELDEEVLSPDNISEVQISVNGGEPYTLVNQVLRTFYYQGDGTTFIRLSEMTEIERLEADYNAKLDYLACMTGVDLDE